MKKTDFLKIIIEFITTAVGGTTQDFGDLTGGTRQGCGFSNSTRALRVGGIDGPSHKDIIDFVTISVTGTGTDFGDLSVVREAPCGASNAHGGLV